MKKAYRIIAVALAIGALAQIIDGFAEFVSRLDDILSPNGRPVNPTASGMLRNGFVSLASAAPTLLISAIFFHMETIIDAISRPGRAVKRKEHGDESG